MTADEGPDAVLPSMKAPLLPVSALVALPIVLPSCSQREPGTSADHASTAHFSTADAERALAALDVVYEVLQHPRCLNCHPAGDRPLQYDAGRPHGMNVVRGPDDGGVAGMRCVGCHGDANAPLPHMPPGVSTGWRLAPREMVFEGLSKRELAEVLLDPERSHMTPDELLHHIAHDPLVLWGWEPGPGREPVPVAHADFVAAFTTWIEAGAPASAESE